MESDHFTSFHLVGEDAEAGRGKEAPAENGTTEARVEVLEALPRLPDSATEPCLWAGLA